MAVVGLLILSKAVLDEKASVSMGGHKVMCESLFKSYGQHAWSPCVFSIRKGAIHP
jgi:hypothetical protein